jgi:exportin-1
MDVLNVYKVYSMEISNTVAQQGAGATQTSIIRAMRAVKKETLLLQETFIERSEDEQVPFKQLCSLSLSLRKQKIKRAHLCFPPHPQVLMNNFIPPLLEAVLIDYQNNIPDARDPEVLSLMCVIINRFKVLITTVI